MGRLRRLGDGNSYRLRDTIRIGTNVAVPEPHHSPADLLKPRGALRIVSGGIDVLATVDLDRDLLGSAGKIENVAANGKLAGELWLVVPQPCPQ